MPADFGHVGGVEMLDAFERLLAAKTGFPQPATDDSAYCKEFAFCGRLLKGKRGPKRLAQGFATADS
jgi:hypothetical protein